MNSRAFYAHADTALEDKPSGRDFVDLVDGYVKSGLTAPSLTSSPSSSSSPTTPLCLVQLGRQPPTASTNILFTTNEIECWVKDDEQSKAIEEETRKRVQEKEEAKQENGKKRRKIKEAKQRDLLQLLEGM
ncbi:unnamed protein product [Aureobasidium mustum]|uniref:Uncharacterized protein n=1 Tax=Aureobasidium mustum TaxID=2773714 RepID=A0A9N8JI09_9PEZI|nr:unnamed protein product [Aureobasidium mustum]